MSLRIPLRRLCSGFTLIEVLVALGIVAIALAAIAWHHGNWGLIAMYAALSVSNVDLLRRIARGGHHDAPR